MADNPLIVETGHKNGRRLSLFGRSGSGKTYLGKWFVQRSPGRWVILDTKHDPGYDGREWIKRSGLTSIGELMDLWRDYKTVVVRPSARQTNVVTMDGYLEYLHEGLENFGLFIDETYQVTGLNEGPGLRGLVTRGRAKGQGVIMGSQRPSRLPLFCFTESNAYACMSLSLEADRKKVAEWTGKKIFLQPMEPRDWRYYDVDSAKVTWYGPVTIGRPQHIEGAT